MSYRKAIEDLEMGIKASLEDGDDSAVESWENREGVLLSRYDAENILQRITTLTAEVERLEKKEAETHNLYIEKWGENEELKEQLENERWRDFNTPPIVGQFVRVWQLVYDKAIAEGYEDKILWSDAHAEDPKDWSKSVGCSHWRPAAKAPEVEWILN